MSTSRAKLTLPIDSEVMNRKMFLGLLGSRAVYSLAAGMALLFIPLYLYKLSGLFLMALWLMFTGLADFLTVKYIAKLAANLGYKKSVLLGQIIWTGSLIFLFMAKKNLYFLIPAGAAFVLAEDLYWISNHLLFLMSPAKKFGNEASLLNIVCTWSAVLGPIIGGIFAMNSGFGEVFGIGAILMLLAAVPVLILEPDNLKWDFHLKHYWEKIGDNWFSRDLFAFVGLGIEDVMYNFIWPVFLLIILGNSYTSLGAYKTAVLAVTTVIMWLVGKKIDRGGVHKSMMAASVILMACWILRGWLVVPGQLLILDMLDGWVGILVWLPFSVYTFRRAVLADKPLYVVEREASIRFGKTITGIGFGIMVAFGWKWNVMVLMGLAGLILMNFLPKIGPKKFEEMEAERK